KGVKDVDTGIKIVLHLDRGNDLASSRNFIQNAMMKAVPFDVFAESCYTGTQGQPSDWLATFTALSTAFPTVKLMIAEYSTSQRPPNAVIFTPATREVSGTSNGQPGPLWTRSGTPYTVQANMSI